MPLIQNVGICDSDIQIFFFLHCYQADKHLCYRKKSFKLLELRMDLSIVLVGPCAHPEIIKLFQRHASKWGPNHEDMVFQRFKDIAVYTY